MTSNPIALTIASSDSSGGAGIQADLKAFSAVGTHGCSVIVCITAQNISEGVNAIHELPLDIIEEQFEAIIQDFTFGAIKTGMLYSPEIVKLIGGKVKEYRAQRPIPLVVDPVLIATTGKELSKGGEFIDALKTELIPKATIVMPNLYEAGQLLKWDVETLEDMQKAAVELAEFGSENVLIKGGHTVNTKGSDSLTAEAIDILYRNAPELPDEERFSEFTATRAPKLVHGSGCTFSALITGLLAQGMELRAAIEAAKARISSGIKCGYYLTAKQLKGEAIAMIDLSDSGEATPEHQEVRRKLALAVNNLKQMLTPKVIPELVPEVGINFGYALPAAQSPSDICALEGRLVKLGDHGVATPGNLKFGASKHVAAIILAAMQHDTNIRAVMNIKYRAKLLEIIEHTGLRSGAFDRSEEPEGVSTMEWGTSNVIENMQAVPDVIFDKGGVGKEPMIRIFGEEPDVVLNKLMKIINKL
ncbi:MAG: bifunctional hydroxymethylpyrimidine kinase/phosphomethylpyrimidine kinase [Thermoplasmata archaeon]|nr:bifunctional hydroxymethylpyrimidine kinase/phosphomethylpyrimidine kinase [Thermoplasmata archaeon]